MAAQETTAEAAIAEVITQDPKQVSIQIMWQYFTVFIKWTTGFKATFNTISTQESPMVLHLHKPKTDKKVQWREGTVDNEFMGKKSSKCTNVQCKCKCVAVVGGQPLYSGRAM